MTTDKSSTDGVWNLDLLTGPTVRLWPYAPGVYGRDALYKVWRAMEDDGATRQSFWDEGDSNLCGDLASFVKAFDGGTNKVLLMVEDQTVKQLVGCIWFTEIRQGHQAFASIWMKKSHRGQPSVDASRLALNYVFTVNQLKQVWSITPWPVAGRLCQKLGYKLVARLTNFFRRNDDFKDVLLYRLARESYHG